MTIKLDLSTRTNTSGSLTHYSSSVGGPVALLPLLRHLKNGKSDVQTAVERFDADSLLNGFYIAVPEPAKFFKMINRFFFYLRRRT